MSGQLLPRHTPDIFYCFTKPTPVEKPQLLIYSKELCDKFNIPENDDFLSLLSGSKIQNLKPYSTRYGGHQFGHWAGQLGDGRAITLGETSTLHWEIQLKGAGITPYSRRGDGRAVLRSSLREFLCSEAMHYLGIPTTRALSCVLSGEQVIRDMFYDGNPQAEPGAIVTRVSPSFLRFGHFEIFYLSGEHEQLKELLTFSMRYFPGHQVQDDIGIANWFEEICVRTAKLMAHWQSVGFVHGVMNTDNMSILGLTIDYGPYGWLDTYDPYWTPNTTDFQHRRYRFGNQPNIALWNLTRFAEALSVLVKQKELLLSKLHHYREKFYSYYYQFMWKKLGFSTAKDPTFIHELETLLQLTEVDPTIFFRSLSDFIQTKKFSSLLPAFYEQPNKEIQNKFELWLNKYSQFLKEAHEVELIERMNQANPCFILRNYLVQEALDEYSSGNRQKIDQLYQALQTPYEMNSHTESFFKKRPDWARSKPGCSTLSCSS